MVSRGRERSGGRVKGDGEERPQKPPGENKGGSLGEGEKGV